MCWTPTTPESFSPSAPASMDIFCNGQGAVCAKRLAERFHGSLKSHFGEKMRRYAAHARSFFKTPCFWRAF
jgi:hypothetical protein